MFKNFILKLRSSYQPEIDCSTGYINNTSQQNNPKIGDLTDYKKQNKHKETKDDKDSNNAFNTIPDKGTDSNNKDVQKNVEVQQLNHYDSIISSDGEIEITKEIVNDTDEQNINELDSILDNNTCRELEKLFENDITVNMLNSTEKEILETVDILTNNNECETAELIDDTVDLLENVIEDQNVTNILDMIQEIQNTESMTNRIDTDEILDEIVNKNETSEELPCELNMPYTNSVCDSSETQVIDENTKTCLKEFNKVFNKVQSKEEPLFKNLDDSIEGFDDIILVEDSDSEIDPLSLVDVKMFDKDNVIIINDDDGTDKQYLPDKSQPKDVQSCNTKIINASVQKTNEFKTVESNNIETLKETLTGSDKNIGLNNNSNSSMADLPKDKSSDKNILEIDADDIISISSEDEMDVKPENVQQNNTQTCKVNIGSKICKLTKIPADIKYLNKRQLRNVKKVKVFIKKPRTNIAKNAVEKTALGNLSRKTKENVESVLIINKIKKWNDASTQNTKDNKAGENNKNISLTFGVFPKSERNIESSKTMIGISQEPNITIAELSNGNRQELDILNKTPENCSNAVTEANEEDNLETIISQEPNITIAEPLNGNKQELDILNKTPENCSNAMTEANEEDNLETISAISEELEKMTTKSDEIDDCGYHSSDFEFITEEEAKKKGLLTNDEYERKINNFTRQKHSYPTRNTVQNDPYGPGPSNRSPDNSEDQENYVVPDENELINIFQALPPMPLSEIHYLENKSIRSREPMLVQYEGVGFDMSLALHEDHSGQEYCHEAQQSMKKILDMYPENNTRTLRKPRKRRRMI